MSIAPSRSSVGGVDVDRDRVDQAQRDEDDDGQRQQRPRPAEVGADDPQRRAPGRRGRFTLSGGVCPDRRRPRASSFALRGLARRHPLQPRAGPGPAALRRSAGASGGARCRRAGGRTGRSCARRRSRSRRGSRGSGRACGRRRGSARPRCLRRSRPRRLQRLLGSPAPSLIGLTSASKARRSRRPSPGWRRRRGAGRPWRRAG